MTSCSRVRHARGGDPAGHAARVRACRGAAGRASCAACCAAEATTSEREFQPLLSDVRELVDRIVAEKRRERRRRRVDAGAAQADARTATCTARRSSSSPTASRTSTSSVGDGAIHVLHPASGLVTALEPVMRACSGVWVAHGSGSADRETVDAHGRVRVPPGEESYTLRRVWLTRGGGAGLLLRLRERRAVAAVPRRAHAADLPRRGLGALPARSTSSFADAVCDEVDSDDPIVLVQDYHFALAPRLIRERLPRATIITFWHIPWPNAERFGICPWREELLEGMLGAASSASTRSSTATTSSTRSTLPRGAHRSRAATRSCSAGARTLVRPYPISIEWPNRWLADGAAGRRSAARSVFAELGLARRTRCSASASTASTTPRASRSGCSRSSGCSSASRSYRGRFTFVQLAAPSRTQIERYRELNERVEALADAHQRSASARTATARSSCCARTTSRRRCSATTAPPTSAT